MSGPTQIRHSYSRRKPHACGRRATGADLKHAKTRVTNLAHEGDTVQVQGARALLGGAEFHEGVLIVDAASHHRVAGGRVEVDL